MSKCWSGGNPFVIFEERPELPENISDIDPGYIAYRIEPLRFYVPESYLKEDGLDGRIEVEMNR